LFTVVMFFFRWLRFGQSRSYTFTHWRDSADLRTASHTF
jgi:hypothetical protein